MTNRKFRTVASPSSSSHSDAQAARKRMRHMLLETLEQRHLMAYNAPSLIGIQTNNSDLLANGSTSSVAPRELTFRFDDAQVIDASTLAGIRLTRSGNDGTFGQFSADTDFGSTGAVNVQFTARAQAMALTVQFTSADLGVGVAPQFAASTGVLSVTLNSNATSPTTADGLVSAINLSPVAAPLVIAKINGGLGTTVIGNLPTAVYSPLKLTQSNDVTIQPGAALVGANPNENEVTLRFAEALPDDNYRIEVFGFDDPARGIVGLRNVGTSGNAGLLFKPTLPGTRQDTINFRLDLGSQVTSVVPQPVVRDAAGNLQQLRDTVVVYFDADKLDVNSVQNTRFYQLILTQNSVRNTDDLYFNPVSVKYNASANTATLRFASDINELPGVVGPATFRLRIGTLESAPAAPVYSEAAATVISDLNTAGLAKVRFTARKVGEAGAGIQVAVGQSASAVPVVTVVGNIIQIDLGTATVTADDFVNLVRNSVAASSLVSVALEAGSVGTTLVSNRKLSYSPLTLVGLGSSFDTATNIGTIGSVAQGQTSLLLNSSIDPEHYILDLLGASDDPAHRMLPQNLTGSFEDHVNPAFGADRTDGITTVYYNFRSNYSVDSSGNSLVNAITPAQKQRAREALSLWAKNLGVQFVETPASGLTIATGSLSGLVSLPSTQLQLETAQNFGVRIDPTFNNSLVILSSTNTWDDNYGEGYFRAMAAGLGMVLGLQHAGDVPESNLMRLDPTFLAGSGTLINASDAQLDASDEQREPVFPGNQDILHGQYLYRPDGSDIDLYRFDVDLGTSGRVGLFTAETYAQRLPSSSSLDTNLQLFRATQATATTNFGTGEALLVKFESMLPGTQGNHLQIRFTQSNLGTAVLPRVTVTTNTVTIDLNNQAGSVSTVAQVLDALASSSAASKLVKASLIKGLPTTAVGGNVLTENPVSLLGGKMDLVAQNDDYFSSDSLLKIALESGVYFIGVTASGNNDYDPTAAGTGFGGKSQGDYQLRVSFRAQVDTTDAIQDLSAPYVPADDLSVTFDGDGDGLPGGVHNFWFQTRPLDRVLSFNSSATSALEGQTLRIVGANGLGLDFEFDSNGIYGAGRVPVVYSVGDTAGTLANALAAAIAARSDLAVSALANGVKVTLRGERMLSVSPSLQSMEVAGKTIFVDRVAGPNADGSLARPFNNIASTTVANAFASALPGDIVRIIGNGGLDGNPATIGDNLAYEIGNGLLAGSTLRDGATMDVPRGVTAMIDSGAIFKMRAARVAVGSNNTNIDRSNSTLQVLGTPRLLDASGNAIKQSNGNPVSGNVFFTSWLDESIGFDSYAPVTTPGPGDWGGISYRRDVDTAAGRTDLEEQGIFLQQVTQADIRYGGGSVVVDSVQQSFSPIELGDTRPTITYNRISNAANAAMSSTPNSFEETNFNEPRYQQVERFTSDYDRVGPQIRQNTLLNNSLNGLFIRVGTSTLGSTQTLTVPGRFDDVDIVHILSENLVVSGAPGGPLLDSTTPPTDLVTTAASVGGALSVGTYNYKLSFIDRNGAESLVSNATVPQTLIFGQNAISIAGLAPASGDFVARRLYRSTNTGAGPYELVAVLDRSSTNYVDYGTPTGVSLLRDRADVTGVGLAAAAGGSLATGTYAYRLVMVDAAGKESLASDATQSVAIVAGVNRSIQLSNLPALLSGYVGRRLYRSFNGGDFAKVADIPSGATYTDIAVAVSTIISPDVLGVRRPRTSASLVIDPGSVIKLESSRIEAAFGVNIIAEGTDGLPITFTSKLDDSIGLGGTFDTNNDGTSNRPSPRDWGGIYMSPTSNLSVDYARFSYGGGITKLDSTFRAFNTIELQQADARIANSIFENNADGFGGQGPGTRFGRLSNAHATIFARGTQPTILNNTFRNNAGSPIDIDANSMTDTLRGDVGRQTGSADRNTQYDTNYGPLIRNNRMSNNGINGLEIRGDTLSVGSVWDDTDIAHVLYDGIYVGNIQHDGGLRLQSASNESLVVKFDGYGSNFNRNLGAGITAFGELTSGTNRVGGTLHVLGQPGYPVILTSLKDDTVGAGLQPNGAPQTDTNNDGIGSIPQAADWRGVLLDQYSNDRNVAPILEYESATAAAPGSNGSALTAQSLGDLAAKASDSNETLRLGFVVSGVLSQREDVDVYSFTAEPGTEIWLDVDHTKFNTDFVIELLDANGALLARSDNSTAETNNPALLTTTGLISTSSVNPLPVRKTGVRTTADGQVKEDGTTNTKDPGMRILLPGTAGSRSNFFFRVRSASSNPNAVDAGLTKGNYEVQIRLREAQEFAGSAIDIADIRYSMNGVHLRGLPGTSPLIGEAQEDESASPQGATLANNGTAIGQTQTGSRPQFIGNILETAKGAISVGGSLSSATDLDFYRMTIKQQDIVGSMTGGYVPVVFDMDYADGLNRPDTSINIFVEEFSSKGTQYRLVYSGDTSNIADDQKRPLSTSDLGDLTRGSLGTKDAYIGPIALPEGTYLVGISSAGYQPRAKIINPFTSAPINSVRRIVDEGYVSGVTTADPPVVQNFLPRKNIGGSGILTSKTFDLGAYSASDSPAIYLGYTNTGTFTVSVKDASGAETLLGTYINAASTTANVKLSLANFAGQDGLSLVFRNAAGTTSIDSLIVGFAERGEQIGVGTESVLLNGTNLGISQSQNTRVFSLETYTFADRPSATFAYTITSGELDVFVNDGFTSTRIASSEVNTPVPNGGRLTKGSQQTATLDLSLWAGQPGLTIEFRTRTDNPTNVRVNQVTLVLGDGSRVGSGEYNPTYASVNVPAGTVTTGQYQFEVRLAESFFTSNGTGGITLTKSIDTNDRLADQVTITAPAAALITDGDRFEISDGAKALIFEFSSDASVSLGAIPVRITSTDPNYVVAQRIRDAINNPTVQSQLNVRAATTSGIESGTSGRDPRLNLFGKATFRTLVASNPSGAVQVTLQSGKSDQNIARDQSQMIVQNSFIRQSRDYGVWSEPAARLADDRDAISTALATIMQPKPNLAGTQAVRNLPYANDSVSGGLMPGVVIRNNVLEEGGLGGIQIQGENPIWMISPRTIPSTDASVGIADAGTHFGSFLDDGDRLIIDSDRTRLRFEFEDIAGASTASPTFGSGVVGGDGYQQTSTPIWYRDDAGSFYYRPTGSPPFAIGTTALETMMAMRDSILGSAFVTNGTTQQVRVTVGESLQGPVPGVNMGFGGGGGGFGGGNSNFSIGYPNDFNRPALYVEGVTNIQFDNVTGGGNPFIIDQLPLGQSPQPQSRIVNNTIIGTDGRASFNGQTTPRESNDTLDTATETWQGTAHNPLSYTAVASIGDNPTLSRNPSQDVDTYQFKLDLGERVIIDLDSNGSPLDSVIQVFDSRGVIQSFTNRAGNTVTSSDNDAAPGETVGLDSYVDFTATAPGVYYAVVSSTGNTAYDPLSMANRKNGLTTGAYTLDLSVRHLQNFTITAEDASSYSEGQTFTIFGVPDIGATNSAGRTFEFTYSGNVTPGNIPIRLAAGWFFPDVARAIAKAINEGGVGGTPAVPNTQSLPNGQFGNASPLPAVHAVALGGLAGVFDAPLNTITGDPAVLIRQFSAVDEMGTNALSRQEIERQISGPYTEVNQGLQMFPRRTDGNYPTHSSLGIGHDRGQTGAISNTSIGDGTTEKFILVKNAAFIRSNGNIIVDPDANTGTNLDQILPETGILASRGASPTILNNVFFNLQTPVVNEESRRYPLGGLAPYGTVNPNVPVKPGEVIIGGSIYQYDEPGIANLRFNTGIEAVPTNIPNSAMDLNTDIADGVRLFVNPQASQYYPAPKSPLIDSAVDSLPERPALVAVKNSIGIPASPIKAPSTDLVGQLRVDDPEVASPSGQGQNVFKDRGAFDRADFIGPAAQLLAPIDNDASGIDIDSTLSVVQLTSGVYPEFRIQLADGNEPSNPLRGVGIDDNTVINSLLDGARLAGASVVVFEDGRLLQEGMDYRFDYDTTRNEIVLTPLAGVWRNNHIYEISLNNKDRFVITAPNGAQVSDGDSFTITDSSGGVVNFEFDSGYRLQVPQGLTLQAPLAGGASGGVSDGDRFSITDNVRTVTFEFDRNANTLSGNVPVLFTIGSSQADIAQAVASAIATSGLQVTPRILSNGRVFLGAETNVRVNTNFTALTQPATTLALKIPDLGPRPGGITDGQTFTIFDGRRTVTFEYDNNGSVATGNSAINFASASTVSDLAKLTQAALAASPLTITPSLVGNDLVHIGLTVDGTVSVGTSKLVVLGVSRTLTDGQNFVVADGGSTKTFEFTRDAAVSPGNIAIPVALSDTQDEIGQRVATAIAAAGLGLTPVHVGDGNVAVRGNASTSINVANAPQLGLYGSPGVQSNTRLQVFGPLVMQVPSRGGIDIVDNRVFTIINNGRTVTFEFDNNFSGPSQPGNVLVRYTATSTANEVATAIAAAISTTQLGINPVLLTNGRIDLGILETNQVVVGSTGLTTYRGVVSDGESFTIDNGVNSITFEFENVDLGNGFTTGRIPIYFGSSSTPDTVVATMKAVIEGTTLGLTTVIMPGGVLQLNDTPRYVTTTTNAPSLRRSGVPGGAQPVYFIQDGSFDAVMMKKAIIAAINSASNTTLQAKERGGSTLFVENAVAISSEIDNYYLQGIADLAGNNLKPNRINNESAFTILMPGVELDYGDAPDPVVATPGRYPTLRANDGARHAISLGQAILGAAVDAETDGAPVPNADSDNFDDGVKFGSTLNPLGVFNRNIYTDITVTLSSPGFVDGWIDFNNDGDWEDPGEQVLSSKEFIVGNLTQTFQVTVPSTAPVPPAAKTTFARFRSSTTGGLLPTGLAVDGEVEDYVVTVVPGTPPSAVNDVYSIAEDTTLVTTDVDGKTTIGFTLDDGVVANDFDPEGGPLTIIPVSIPSTVTIDPSRNGLFTFVPPTDFNGPVTFTYRVTDGLLVSNNIATASITVREENDTPIANGTSVQTDEDKQLVITSAQATVNDKPGPITAVDEVNQILTVTGVDTNNINTKGTVALVAGQIVYTPPQNFIGQDKIFYTVTDNGTSNGIPAPKSAQGVILVDVRDKNDPPVPGALVLQATEDTLLTIPASTILAGATPGPSNESSQTVSLLRVLSPSTAGGTVVIQGTNVLYTPAADFVGTDTFYYEIQDNGFSGGVYDPQTAIGMVTVQVSPVNDAPRVKQSMGSKSVDEDSSVTPIDLSTVFYDPDVANSGDSLTYIAVANSRPDLVTVQVSGVSLLLTLVPDANSAVGGPAVIVVRARDSQGATVDDTLSLTVVPVNDPPRLVAPIPDQTMNEDAVPLLLTLIPTYFTDPDVSQGLDQLMLAVVSNSNPLLVTPTVVGNDLKLMLSPNQIGGSQITVRAYDNLGLSVLDTFILNVLPVNDPPIGVPDTYTVPQFGTLAANDPRGTNGISNDNGVLANDIDADGDALSAQILTQPQYGSVVFNSNGTFAYVHTGATRATDTFSYRAFDGQAFSLPTTVTINVGPAIPPPHQNPILAPDVNADGIGSPIDALLIISFLNANPGTNPVSTLPAPPPYRDVDGNNFITPRDVLLVIQYLNSNSGAGGEGEGGPSSDTDISATLASLACWQIDATRLGDNQPMALRRPAAFEDLGSGASQPQPLGLAAALADLSGEVDGESWLNSWTAAIEREPVARDQAERDADAALASLIDELSPRLR